MGHNDSDSDIYWLNTWLMYLHYAKKNLYDIKWSAHDKLYDY